MFSSLPCPKSVLSTEQWHYAVNYGSCLTRCSGQNSWNPLYCFFPIYPTSIAVGFYLEKTPRIWPLLTNSAYQLYHPNQSHHYFLPELAQQSPHWAPYCRHVSLRMKAKGLTQCGHTLFLPCCHSHPPCSLTSALPILDHILRAPLCRFHPGCSLSLQVFPPDICRAHPLPQPTTAPRPAPPPPPPPSPLIKVFAQWGISS